MRSVTTSSRLTPDLYSLVVSLILLLVCHFIIKKIGLGQYIANDFFSMQNAFSWECTFKTSGAFSFLPRCVTLLSSYIYQIPILYLAAITLILLLKFYFLFKVFEVLAGKATEPALAICIAAFALLLVSVGGAGRFNLGSGNILVLADIYTRTWAQVFLLATLYAFVINRLVLASCLLGLALLLQAVNTTNFAIILGIAYLFSGSPRNLLRLPLLGSPFLIFFAYQYYIAYGIPSFSLDQLYVRDADEAISTTDWYRYIYSQDPDDLSILFQFRQGWVSLGYIFLGFVGLFFGSLVEKAGSIRATLMRPGMAIMIAGYLYIALCAAVEYFQTPIFILKNLIVLQPRRIMYLPQLVATLYFASYTIEFFFRREHTNGRRWITLVVLYAIFGTLLALSAWDNGAPPSTALLYVAFLISIFTAWFLTSRHNPGALSRIPIPWALSLLSLLIVSAQTLPHLSAKTLTDFKLLFFTTQPRDYAGYLSVTARLSNQSGQIRNFFDMAAAISSLPPESGSIITVGINQQMQKDFSIFAQKGVLGVDPFTAARGGAHYDKSRLVGIAPVLTQTSNLPLDEFIKLGRDKQIRLFEEFARDNIVTSPALVRTMIGTGEPAEYLLFADSCPDASPKDYIIYANDDYCLYRSSFWPMHKATTGPPDNG